MSNESNISALQSVVRAAGLDGWLLYDFRGLNPFPAQLLKLGRGILTRRWFLYVPAHGRRPSSIIASRRAVGSRCCRMRPSIGKPLPPMSSWMSCCAKH